MVLHTVSHGGSQNSNRICCTCLHHISGNIYSIGRALRQTSSIKSYIYLFINPILFFNDKFNFLQKKTKLWAKVIKSLHGNSKEVNFDEPLDGQLQVLCYDKQWEFPKDQLKLGKR